MREWPRYSLYQVVVIMVLVELGCGVLMPAAKTAKDIAVQACRLSLDKEAEAKGLSVADLCDKLEVYKPFLDSILGAKREVSTAQGLKLQPEPGE